MSVTLAPPMALFFPNPNNSGSPAAGFQLFTYQAGSSTKQATWTDSTQTVQLPNPIILDANGAATVWGDPTIAYKFVFTSPNDSDPPTSPLRTVDNFYFPLTTGAAIAPTFARSAAETTFGIPTPFLQYPVGNFLRYGVIPNSVTSAASNTAILVALFNPFNTGPTGQFVFPNTTGSDVYYFTAPIPIRSGVHIDLNECTIQLGTAIAPATSSAGNWGLFLAQQDFRLENGSISVFFTPNAVQSSAGYAVQLGMRGIDTSQYGLWPTPTYDSALPGNSLGANPQGNCVLLNLKISMTIPQSGNYQSCGAIALIGGLQNVLIENVVINGNGTLWGGIVYEFGWATQNAITLMQQTSHMHDCTFRNISVNNMANAVSTDAGIVLTGAYNCKIENFYFNQVSDGIIIQPGQAGFYRPWVGVDDIGAKRSITIRNVVGENFTVTGLVLDGTSSVSVGSLLTVAWTATTAYSNGGGAAENSGQTVINGGNIYVCKTSGTSAGSGGPTGTGTGIADGSCTWDYVPLSNSTDLLDVSVDGFALSAINGSAEVGMYIKAGRADIRNGTCSGSGTGAGMYVGLQFSDECTNFSIDGVKVLAVGQTGMVFNFGAAIYSPARLKKGTIRNCFIAGSSGASTGTYGGLAITNCDGVTIENCRFGHETAYDGLNEIGQAQAVNLSGTTASNVVLRGCRVGGANGNIGLVNTNAANTGNGFFNCTFNASGTFPVSTIATGGWQSDLEFNFGNTAANGITLPAAAVFARTCRVNPTASITGVIVAKGTYQGQQLTIFNEASSFTITMAASGTSNVADGASCVIAVLTQKTFAWDVGSALWYHS